MIVQYMDPFIWNKSRIVTDNVFQAMVVCLLIHFVVSVPYCCVCMYTVSICIYLYVKELLISEVAETRK